MTQSRFQHRLAWVVLLAALALQVPLRTSARRENSPSPAVVYVTSGKVLRDLSLGYNGLLADIYWTRAVQYYGRQRLSRDRRFDSLGDLLRISTTLDRHLLIAYRFGAVFLAEKPPAGAGRPEDALQLLRRGIVANPGYWRLWEDLGFIYYWDLHDYAAAARAFQAGSERPGAEIWMNTLAATVAARGGEIHTSQLLWSEIYRTAQNDAVRKSAFEHLAALKASEDLQKLDQVLAVYQRHAGRPARSFQNVIAAGLLRGIPRDSSGAPYGVGPDGKAHLGAQSKIEMRLVERQ